MSSKEYNRRYRETHREEIRIKSNAYNKKRRIERPEVDIEYRKTHQDQIKRYRDTHKKRQSILNKRWRMDNVQRKANGDRQYYLKNKKKAMASAFKSLLKRAYSITVDDYDAMLKKQNKVCAICGGGKGVGRGRLHVDHCHATGRIRGLLCMKCNTMLGLAGDSVKVLNAAIKYLKFELN